MPIVLDACVAATWCFPDEKTEFSDQLLARLEIDSALVPPIFWLEILNVLLVSERRGQIEAQDSYEFLKALHRLPIQTRANDVGSSIAEIARRHGLTSYDARYLELAQSAKCPFATLDRRLAHAAETDGLQVFSHIGALPAE